MRTKNSFKTIVYGVIMTGLIALVGLFKTKILLEYIGEDSVAIYQLFAQIYTYLSLVDGGMTSAMIYYLYKPIRDKNYEEISEKINGVSSYFRNIGFLIIIIGLILSINIMFFVKQSSLSPMYIRICFIIFIIASACSYFASSHAVLYEAEQKLYKSSNLNHGLNLIKGIVEIILVINGFDLLTLMFSFLILSILKNIILIIISKKDHKYLVKTNKKNKDFKKEANSLFVQKISSLVFENIDVFLLSKFTNSISVVIYTVYYQITHMITLMIKRVNSAIIPSIGDMLLDTNKEHARNLFDEINALLFYIAFIVCIPLYFALNPFINLWYGEKYVSSNLIALLFVLILFITIISIVLDSYIRASGNFKSIKYWSIYQSVINLILSFLLVNKYGMLGVLSATVISFITGNFISYPYVVSKKILERKQYIYYKNCLIYLLILILVIPLCYYVGTLLSYKNLIHWLLSSLIIFVINFVLVTGYFYLTKNLMFLKRFKYLLRSKKCDINKSR